MSDVKRTMPSDHPPEDLIKERDAFIQQFFRKGAELTEELLEENDRLRARMNDIEAENGKLRAHLASNEAIRDLLRKIDQLEQEKRELSHRSAQMEAVSRRYTHRFSEVENELANLANLYVATSQLHGAHSVRHVLRNLKELLAQLLGAARFAIYLVAEDGAELVSIASEGVNAAEVARLPADRGMVGSAFSKAELFVERTRDISKATIAEPAAIVPLAMDGKTVGVIAIFGTLPQKTEFVSTDGELFRLLGAQAAPALVSARLFTDAGRKMPPIRAFFDLED